MSAGDLTQRVTIERLADAGPEANQNTEMVRLNVRHGGQKVTKNAEIGYTKTGPKMPKWVRLMPRARGADLIRVVLC